MPSGWLWKPVAAVVAGVAIMLAAGLSAVPAWSGAFVAMIAGAAVAVGSLVLLRKLPEDNLPESEAAQLDRQRTEFEQLRLRVAGQLEEETARLEIRQRELADRFVRFHEFLEYPDVTQDAHLSHDTVARLSEQDRQVQRILEAEAQRVYEKIRANGYWVAERIDNDAIRNEVFDLIQRVARVYNPGSRNPLLETSFEQLARAASRVCLHVLVVLEQLPLDVQQYNINSLYSYVRRAITSYGAYQKASPWLSYLSRGAYLGRFAAGANPLTVGAWWLATELGKRGAAKFVENVVDRQAIAVLHDVVTVLGVEVSNVYGPGHRQRDPAWVLGSEIAELTQRFPLSRESLKEALRLVTSLPLRSEYDRIYLYRCLAEHRAAGLRINDPAMLTREQREQIAKQLEHFFTHYIHGATERDTAKWKADVEHRLDLRLSLANDRPKQAGTDPIRGSVESIHAFLTSVTAVSAQQAEKLIEQTALVRRLPPEQRASLFQSLTRDGGGAGDGIRFEPPDLDPADELTELFLNDLDAGVVATDQLTPMVESVLLETGAYFRRTAVDMQATIDSASVARFRQRCAPAAPLADVAGHAARTVLNHMQPGETITGFYTAIDVIECEGSDSLTDIFLVCLADSKAGTRRAMLLQSDAAEPVVWSSDDSVRVARKDGYLIDDCAVSGGLWSSALTSPGVGFVVSGIFRGGGYEKWFAPLIALNPSEET